MTDETPRYQRCLEAAQDAFEDAQSALSLREQLWCLNRAHRSLADAIADPQFPHWFAWQKSDGTMAYTFPGPSPLIQTHAAIAFVDNCFNNAVRHLREEPPRTLVGEMFGRDSEPYLGPRRPQ